MVKGQHKPNYEARCQLGCLLYEMGLESTEVMRLLHMTGSVLAEALRRYEIKPRGSRARIGHKRHPYSRTCPSQREMAVCWLYEMGFSRKAISQYIVGRIDKILKAHDIKPRRKNVGTKVSKGKIGREAVQVPIDRQYAICFLYDLGAGFDFITKRFAISHQKLREFLRRHGIKSRKSRARSVGQLRKHLLQMKIVASSGCWEWTGLLTPEGYGAVSARGLTNPTKTRRFVLVHRLAAHLWKGFDLGSPLCICHICDNRKCFNPDHLFEGTKRDNTMDAVNKGILVLNGRGPNYDVLSKAAALGQINMPQGC